MAPKKDKKVGGAAAPKAPKGAKELAVSFVKDGEAKTRVFTGPDAAANAEQFASKHGGTIAKAAADEGEDE